MQERWDFKPSKIDLRLRLRRATLFVADARRAPASKVVARAFPASAWTVYFVYAPTGQLTAAHSFTIDRLKRLPRKLCVVIASPRSTIPPALIEQSDALIWKDLGGYDFSAYALGLREIAARSPRADVLVLNDSVLGPFADLEKLLASAPWQVTGFSASAERENHIQSYAFQIRDLTSAKLASLRSVLLPGLCMQRYQAVVLLQETRLARCAARSFSVGALWYDDTVERPLLSRPFELLDRGFPFLKKSLLGKESHMQKTGAVCERLRQLGHPER